MNLNPDQIWELNILVERFDELTNYEFDRCALPIMVIICQHRGWELLGKSLEKFFPEPSI
jgi:hypothetical protein